MCVEKRKVLLGFSSSKRRRGSVLPPLTTTGMHTSGKRVDTRNGIREAVNNANSNWPEVSISDLNWERRWERDFSD